MGTRNIPRIKILRKRLGNTPETAASTPASTAQKLADDGWWRHEPYADWQELYHMKPTAIPATLFMIDCFADPRVRQQHPQFDREINNTLDHFKTQGVFSFDTKLFQQLQNKINHLMGDAVSKEERTIRLGAVGLTPLKNEKGISRDFGNYQLQLMLEDNGGIYCKLIKQGVMGIRHRLFRTTLTKDSKVKVDFDSIGGRDMEDQRAIKLCLYGLLADSDLLTELLLAPRLT